MRLLPLAASVVVILSVGAPRRAEATDSTLALPTFATGIKPQGGNSAVQRFKRIWDDSTVGLVADWGLSKLWKKAAAFRAAQTNIGSHVVDHDGSTPLMASGKFKRFGSFHQAIEETMKAVGEGGLHTRLSPRYEAYVQDITAQADGSHSFGMVERLGTRVHGGMLYPGQPLVADGKNYQTEINDKTAYASEKGFALGPLYFGRVVMIEAGRHTATGTRFARRAFVFRLGPISFKFPTTAKGVYDPATDKFSGGLLHPLASSRYKAAHIGKPAPPYKVESAYLRLRGNGSKTPRTRSASPWLQPAPAHP